MNANEAYLLARAYTNKALEGAGALKGAPCQIKSITSITGGHRVTFEWEDSEGETSTETMDVMNGTNGTDGDDGVGISSITYKEEDQDGNYVYTVLLTNSSSYDITCPKGPQGSTGQTGAAGNGIVSIEKTSTAGLVDTYTITYTNGQTTTFTVTNGESITVDSAMSGSSTNPVQNKVITEALANKQNTITAGDDLKFSGSTLNVEVSVPYIDEYDLSTDGNGWIVVTKKHKGEVVSTNTYQSGTYATYDIDGCFTLACTGGTPYWQVTLTKASTDDPAGTTYGWGYGETPSVSSISFELAETGTASEFITALGISVDGLANSKQPKTDNNLTTTSKEVTGAINEVKSGLTNVGTVIDSGTFANGNVTAEGQSYITLFDSLSAGSWVICINYASDTACIVTDDRPWTVGRTGDIGTHGGTICRNFATPTTIRLYVNSDDTSDITFYRALARAVKVSV